ncbi:MAG TPA: hypothetical protein VE442_20970 [Jatrophihabitans sp.]|nr:hypothetical protein [Jatrophihabitans sp.]
MNQRALRRCIAFASAAAAAVTLLLASSPTAGAAEPGIRKPRMTVVCSQPHHNGRFAAVRYTQRGLWAAGAQVTVTITKLHSERPRARVVTTTGPAGWFHINRVLVRKHTSRWRAGTRYAWTTVLSTDSAATARRGTVLLRGSC